MWLRDFLHLDFPDIWVLTWGYHSGIKDDRSTNSITALSRKFLVDIKQVRDKERCQTMSRPLILIGHSLGGLVLQKALVDASMGDSAEDKAFHQSCVGVLFFGVPNQGLNQKSIDYLVQGKGNKSFLQQLSSGSDYLFELGKDFKICHENINSIIVSFYESEDTCSVEDYNIIEICADHFRMVKFRPKYDKNYQRVIIKINKMMMVNHEAKLSKTSLTPVETVSTKHYKMCKVQERLQGGSSDSSERAYD
ncbi:hypothetical protein FPQ18DRAFT_381727 [Pyronema domesticum]|nr:hypothetical protein FPQ18DRAFT_381727 [Pyronema domesticum]